MRVSVAIPLYNKANYIQRTLDSVMAQTFTDFEVVVVDDGSTDASREIVRAYDDSRIRLLTQENAGEGLTRDRAIRAGGGAYTALLDADDEWKPHFLETAVRLLDDFPSAGAGGVRYSKRHPDGTSTLATVSGIPALPWRGIFADYFAACLADPPLFSSATIIRRSVFDAINPHPSTARMGADQYLWCQLAVRVPIAYDSTVAAIYHEEADDRVSCANGEFYRHADLPFLTFLREQSVTETLPPLQRESVRQFIVKYELDRVRFLLSSQGDRMLARRLLTMISPRGRFFFPWLKCWIKAQCTRFTPAYHPPTPTPDAISADQAPAIDLVSIIICTYNRADYLPETLRSLTQALRVCPEPRSEIIVVNNGSTDNTDAIMRAFITAHPEQPITMVSETRPGLSVARNTGLSRARGEIICFLDDDVTVPEGWLGGILAGFSLGPHIGAVAGQVRLRWPGGTRPSWLPTGYDKYYSQYHPGDEDHLLESGAVFVGANFALARAATQVVGFFDTALGRKGTLLTGGEDTDYARRIWQSGFTIAYSARGWIDHHVVADRIRVSWLWHRLIWHGATRYLVNRHRFGYPCSQMGKLLSNLLLLPFMLVTCQPRWIMKTILHIAAALGPLYGWWHYRVLRNGDREMEMQDVP